MKKIICMAAALALFVSLTACGKPKAPAYVPPAETTNDKQITGNENPEVARDNNEEPEGLNPGASTEDTKEGKKFNFDGFFSVTLPEGLTVQDNSINTDSSLFTVFDASQTYLDVTYYVEGKSEEAQKAKAAQIAATPNANEVEAITVNDTTFYGVHMPDYGKTQYCGFINGHDVDISIYTDLNNPAVQSFLQSVAFVK